MGQIFIRSLAMPPKVYGATVVDEDGNFNVYVNDRLSDTKKQDTVRHELTHIHGGHFYDDRTVEQDEQAAEAKKGKWI